MDMQYKIDRHADKCVMRLEETVAKLQQCIEILDNPVLEEFTPEWTERKRADVASKLKLTERQVEALKLGAGEIKASGEDCMIDLVKEEMEATVKRLLELDPIVHGPDDKSREWDVAHEEWYRLSLMVLYLTLAHETLEIAKK